MEHPLASALGASKQPRDDKGSSVANSNRALIQTMMAVGVGVCKVISAVLIYMATQYSPCFECSRLVDLSLLNLAHSSQLREGGSKAKANSKQDASV